MHLRCPHCQHNLEVVASDGVQTVPCPSCGSKVHVVPETLSMRRTPKQLGHFELLESLGQGHYGVVWKARDTKLSRLVALKVPRLDLGDDTMSLYMREARAAAKLRHPHIVPVHEVNACDGHLYIVSDLIDGVSLAEYMVDRKVSPERAAELCAELASALEHAHQQGVIHRDLKPANVLLDHEGKPHLTDFGLAKSVGETITVTVDGQVLGTPAYMSPEQARGDAHHADARSDVYSLGVILYELLTGQRPFKGGSRMLVYQVQHEDPRSPRKMRPGVPRDLETICLKAMAKDPAKRYQTAAEMGDDLGRFLRHEPIRARPVSAAERAWRWTKRNRRVAVLGGVIAFLCLSLGGLLAYEATKTPPIVVPTYQVMLDTVPSKATVVFRLLDPKTGIPGDTFLGNSPVSLNLPAGDYFVVAYMPNEPGCFHEVYRHVPGPHEKGERRAVFFHQEFRRLEDGTIRLPTIKLWRSEDVIENMVEFSGDMEFEMGDSNNSLALPHLRAVPAFYLDVHEVQVKEFRDINFLMDSEVKAKHPDDYPLTGMMLEHAIAYAEDVGKCVMDEGQYEFAATKSGKDKFPWGNDGDVITEWKLDGVGKPAFDRTKTTPPVEGLYSGALEMTSSAASLGSYAESLPSGHARAAEGIAIRGGPADAFAPTADSKSWGVGSRHRFGVPNHHRSKVMGFRMARSKTPRIAD